VRRSYTVAEADETLPYVRAIVAEVQETYRRIKDRSRRHNELSREHARRREELRHAIQADAARLHECQEELWQIGAEVKDYELGLVDFPSEFEGRPILLCWKLGEERVTHWHETDEGFSGRQPVPAGQPTWPHPRSSTPSRR